MRGRESTSRAAVGVDTQDCMCVQLTHWRQGAVCTSGSLLRRCEQSTGIFLRLLAAPCAPSARLLWWPCSEGWPVWKEAPCPYTTLSWAGARLHMFMHMKKNQTQTCRRRKFSISLITSRSVLTSLLSKLLRLPLNTATHTLFCQSFFTVIHSLPINMHVAIMTANNILIWGCGRWCKGGRRGQKTLWIKDVVKSSTPRYTEYQHPPVWRTRQIWHAVCVCVCEGGRDEFHTFSSICWCQALTDMREVPPSLHVLLTLSLYTLSIFPLSVLSSLPSSLSSYPQASAI